MRARPLDSVAASVEVIEPETIAAANVRNVAELLEYVAGARVLSTGARGGPTTIQLRGGDPNFVLVLLDGVPLNDPTDVEGGAVNLAGVPIANVERIEVARGPLSYFYGSTALSGIVNIVTRRGTTPRPQVNASLEGGAGSLLRSDVSVAGVAGAGDYSVGFDWEQQQGMLGDDDFEAANFQANFTLPVTRASSLRLTTRAASWEANDYPESSGGPVYGTGELRHSNVTEFGLGADLQTTPADNWRNRVAGYYYERNMERESPSVPPLVPPSVEDTSYWHLHGAWLTTYDVSPNATVSGGLDIDHENGSNASTLFLPPFLGGKVSGDYALSRTTPGTFVEATTRLGNLAFEAGLRADFPEQGNTEWSPRAGARYSFGNGDTSVRGTISRAFKLPSFFALASPPQLGGNPDLRSETSVGVDAGIDQRLAGDAARISFTIFWIRYTDLIDFDFEKFRNVNRDQVNAKGFELALRWDPSDDLSLLSDLTYQNAENTDSEQPLRNLPEWSGSVRMRFRPIEQLELGVEAVFASESFDVQLAVPDINTVSGYGVLDLSATWALRDSWQIIARADNLTDAEYAHFIGFPQPGITGYFGLRYRFR